MDENHVKGEAHGCVVCGKLYQLYVVYSPTGVFLDSKVMSVGGKPVPHKTRPLVACESHSKEQVEAALLRMAQASQDED